VVEHGIPNTSPQFAVLTDFNHPPSCQLSQNYLKKYRYSRTDRYCLRNSVRRRVPCLSTIYGLPYNGKKL
jgi:hypothetical protein